MVAIETICAALSLLLLTLGVILQPQEAACPRGWYLARGIRPDGFYECRRPPMGGEDDAPEPPGVLYGQLHCTGGTQPIVVNERVVGCQHAR